MVQDTGFCVCVFVLLFAFSNSAELPGKLLIHNVIHSVSTLTCIMYA